MSVNIRCFGVAAWVLAASAAVAAEATTNIVPALSAPGQAVDLALPDPLRFSDGGVVTEAGMWPRRRAEIIKLYEEHVFGPTPCAPRPPCFELRAEKRDALNGLACRRLVRIFLLGAKDGPWMDLLVYLPKGAKEPVPAFLGLNFLGNQSITAEPDIPVTPAWLVAFPHWPGLVDHHATEQNRGAQARRWPLELILRRGYAVATACYGEIEPDKADGWKTALRAALSPQGPATAWPQDGWGSIGAWAFGLSRALDYLETVPEIDAKRVAVTGHSRLGKTALWAGAQDTRFALVISNDSGKGGAALALRKQGERIADSVHMNGFWYCPRYRDYADHEELLPVDAHMLIALIAPRPVYVSSATEDVGADPDGEFFAARNAGPVYALFGRHGIATTTPPPPDVRIGEYIGYHRRTGEHDILAADWRHHLDFADQYLKAHSSAVQPALLLAPSAAPPAAGQPGVSPDDQYKKLTADSEEHPGVPKGTITEFDWNSSKIFPNTIRKYWVYVPKQYDPAKPACVFVCQDGVLYKAPTVFDNLIAKQAMPVTVGIFIQPGDFPPKPGEQPRRRPDGRPALRANRSKEYDTLSDDYARFLLEEILPEVGKKYNLTKDPDGRCIAGSSSGGICAWTVCWERPNEFRKCFTTVGSFTNIRGGNKYPELVRAALQKPIRILQQDGANDIVNQFGSWPAANKALAAALDEKGYDHKFVFGEGVHSSNHGTQIFPEVMRWMWRDYIPE